MIITSGLTLDEETHTYRYNGRVCVHPTGILATVGTFNKDIGQWTSMAGTEFAGADPTAARFGLAIHAVAGILVRGGEAKYPEELEPWVQAIRKCLRKEYEFSGAFGEPHIEHSYYNTLYDYAFTPDLWYGTTDRPALVVDWKTADHFQEHWWWQLGAYAEGLRQYYKMTHPPITMIVQIHKRDYTVSRHTASQVRVDFGRFASILNTWRLAR